MLAQLHFIFHVKAITYIVSVPFISKLGYNYKIGLNLEVIKSNCKTISIACSNIYHVLHRIMADNPGNIKMV